jgi:soluble lytic murein transglycosylase-like protein
MKIKFRIICQAGVFMMFLMQIQAQEDIDRVRVRARPVEPIIRDAAVRYGVDPYLLWTVAYLESRFDPGSVSYKDGVPCAFGLMQFVPSTGKRYGLRNPHDPTDAIDAAARYIRDLMARFDGHLDLILAAYNAGEGAVEAYRYGKRLTLPNGKVINPTSIITGGIPPYTETQAYVARGRLVFSAVSREPIFSNWLRFAPEMSASRSVHSEVSIYPSNERPESRNRAGGLSFYVNER